MSRPNSSDIIAIETSMVVDCSVKRILNFEFFKKYFEFSKFSFSQNLFVSKNQVLCSKWQSLQTDPINKCLTQF